MKLLIALLLVCLVVCDFGWLAKGIKIEDPDSFSAKKRDKYRDSKSLIAAFEKIDEDLSESVQTDDYEANIEAAKKLSNKKWALFPSSFGKALKLFLSLEKANTCDLVSYEILAKMKLVVESRDAQQSLKRIRSVANEFRRRSAEQCRPYYRQEFHELAPKMDQTQLGRVATALAYLTSPKMYLSISDDGLAAELRDIARLIAERIDSLAASDRQSNQKSTNLSKNDRFHDYLLKPCVSYVAHFENVLTPARFDAAHEDEAQVPFLTLDKEFGYGLVRYRACQFFIDNREESLESLSQYMREPASL